MKWQGSTTTITTLSGTNGSCFKLAATLLADGGSNNTSQAGYCLPTSTGTYTVSALMSTGTFQFREQFVEYSGQNASTPIDISNVAEPTCVSTSCNCANVTTTVANDVVVCAGNEISGNSQNFLAGSGTLRGSVAAFLGLEDQVQVAAASVTPTFSSAAALGLTFMSVIAVAPTGTVLPATTILPKTTLFPGTTVF